MNDTGTTPNPDEPYPPPLATIFRGIKTGRTPAEKALLDDLADWLEGGFLSLTRLESLWPEVRCEPGTDRYRNRFRPPAR